MSFDNKHPEYQKQLEEWRMIDDALSGERTIKAKAEAYLPKTSGMIVAERDGEDITAQYNAYRMRAQYPEWVRDAVRSMVGMVSKLKPAVTIDYKPLAEMAHNATSDGFPLTQLFLRTVIGNMKKGRFGLLCDVDGKSKPLIVSYVAEAIVNWKFARNDDGRADLSLLVLSEEVANPDDIYGHTLETQYLIYRIIDGKCTAIRLDQSGNAIGEERVVTDSNGQALSFIPFVFSGSIDNAPDLDMVPLLTMAKSAIKFYQLSADFHQELHLTAHPQPVITGQDMKLAKMVTGPAMAWILPAPEAKAYYLEPSGSGIEKRRNEMTEQKNSALEAGARVMDTAGTESGEARKARQNDQYATLQTNVKNSAEAIEQCLRYLGEWFGLSPEQAEKQLRFTVDLDFSKYIDPNVLKELREACVNNLVSAQSYWEYLLSGQMPDHDWEVEQTHIDGQAGAGMKFDDDKLPMA